MATIAALHTDDDPDTLEAWARDHLARPVDDTTVERLLGRACSLNDPTGAPAPDAFTVERDIVGWVDDHPVRRALAVATLNYGTPSLAACVTAAAALEDLGGHRGGGVGLPAGAFSDVLDRERGPRAHHQPLDTVCVDVLASVDVHTTGWSFDVVVPAALSVIASTQDPVTRAAALIAFVQSDPPTTSPRAVDGQSIVAMCTTGTPAHAAATTIATIRTTVDRCAHCEHHGISSDCECVAGP